MWRRFFGVRPAHGERLLLAIRSSTQASRGYATQWGQMTMRRGNRIGRARLAIDSPAPTASVSAGTIEHGVGR